MTDKVPCHVAIIMDGNRRWAEERHLPGLEGHRQGAENIKRIARYCKKLGIRVLTLYAFSTENWGRKKEEVDFLMGLGSLFLEKYLRELHEEGVRILVIGQKDKLPAFVREKMERAENLTKENRDLMLVGAVSYGGRAEIVEGVRKIIQDGVRPEDITEQTFGQCLWTAGLPDIDLMIRTSGEERSSGFLMWGSWGSAYSEFYICQKYWPNFSEEDLDEALAEYGRRKRRFGK